MRKTILTILITMFVTGNVIATICFRACKKRVDITDFWHWKIDDDDWEDLIKL